MQQSLLFNEMFPFCLCSKVFCLVKWSHFPCAAKSFFLKKWERKSSTNSGSRDSTNPCVQTRSSVQPYPTVPVREDQILGAAFHYITSASEPSSSVLPLPALISGSPTGKAKWSPRGEAKRITHWWGKMVAQRRGKQDHPLVRQGSLGNVHIFMLQL